LELSAELVQEVIPNGGHVVIRGKAIDPFADVLMPLCNKWALDKREGESYSLDKGIHSGDELIKADVAFELFDEVIGVFSISGKDSGERSHHFDILRGLGWLLGCIRCWWWGSSSASGGISSPASRRSSSTSWDCSS